MKKLVGIVVALLILGIVGYVAVARNGIEAATSDLPGAPPASFDSTVAKAGAAAANEPAAVSPGPDVPAAATPAAVAAVQPSAPSGSIAQAAIERAATENKHLFLFVSENDNEEALSAKRALEVAASEIRDKAEWASIKRDSAAEKEVIAKFQLDRAPMPIVLALAPNGAITGAYFGENLKNPPLQDSIASSGEQQCLKALQEQKLVFLCLQNAATTSNDAAMQGVNDFKADSRFAKFTEVVTVDPADATEQKFLAELKLNPQLTEATTIFLAPPGSLVSTITGATNKDALVSTLMAATAGGCGPKGCGPKGCAPAKK